MAESVLWSSPYGDNENARDGAERFVREFFGEELPVRWLGDNGRFHFAGAAWEYRITAEAGYRYVRRTGALSPRGKAAWKARAQAKPGEC